jgi:hypothetical protein
MALAGRAGEELMFGRDEMSSLNQHRLQLARQIVHKLLNSGFSEHPDFEHIRALGSARCGAGRRGAAAPAAAALLLPPCCCRPAAVAASHALASQLVRRAAAKRMQLAPALASTPTPNPNPQSRRTDPSSEPGRWQTTYVATDFNQTQSEWVDTDMEMEARLTGAYDKVRLLRRRRRAAPWHACW